MFIQKDSKMANEKPHRKQMTHIQVNNEKNAYISEKEDMGQEDGRGERVGQGEPLGSHQKPFIWLISNYINV